MGIVEIGFIFCLRFRRHLFRHTDFSRFKISKKNFFKNSDFGCHRKMYRLGPCIPIFRVFFFIKSAKKTCICDYVIFGIGAYEKCFLGLKKGISKLLHQVAPKHTAYHKSVILIFTCLKFAKSRAIRRKMSWNRKIAR